jgi:hypothetical protein
LTWTKQDTPAGFWNKAPAPGAPDWIEPAPAPGAWAQQPAIIQPWAKQNAGVGITLWDTLLGGTDWDAPEPLTFWDITLNQIDTWTKQ